MKKEGVLKKELARDFLALGSWVFFVLVLARALVLPYRPFVDQIIIAGIFLVLVGLIWKNWDGYVARVLVLGIFTMLFYYSTVYSWFAVVIGLGILGSAWYVSKDWKKIIAGIVIGLIATGLGYYLSGFSFVT